MQRRLLSWPLALACVVALHALSAHYVVGLRFNNAPEIYYPPGAPAVKLRDALRRDFPSDEALTVLFHGDDLYSAEFLTRLDALVGKLGEHSLVDRVSAVTNFEHIAGTADGFTVQRLVDPSRLKGVAPAQVQARVLGDRFAPGTLASRDGKYLAMAVRPKPLAESGQRLALKVAVAAAINDVGLRPYFAGDAGPVTMDVAQLASILQDSMRFVPLTVGIGLALLAWVVGRWRPVAIGALAMTSVVLPVVAALVASGQPYTMATAILPSLLAAYTVATLLHFYAGVQRAQRTMSDRDAIIDHALAETRKPSAFNVLTTSAGLLSLLLVPIPPIQVFGVAGAAGTLMVFLVVQVLVPPILRRFDAQPWPLRTSGMGRLGHVARRLALWSVRWPKTVVVTLVAIVAALFSWTQKVAVETDMLAFFAPTHPINVDTRRIESALSGVTTLEISVRGRGRDAFQRVENLRQIKRLQDWLASLPEVDRSISMVDLVEEMNWAMNRERPAFRALPGNDRLLRQYLLIYDGEDLYELVNREFDHARIVINLNVHGTAEIRESIDRIRSYIRREPLSDLVVDIGGYGRLLSDQVDLLVAGQLQSFAGAFGQIFLFMAFLWRSFKASALCMAPNLAPLYFLFALMGATGIHLDSATVMIASVVLGITVDDTIHLYHGYLERLRRGLSPMWSIVRSYEASGRAVLATTVVLVAQFALLTASDFIPTANFGLMTAVALLAGLAFEVLLLPALVVLTAGAPWTWRSALGLRRRHPARTSNEPGRAADAGNGGEASRVGDHRSGAVRRRVLSCHGDACKQAGAAAVWRRLAEQRDRLGDEGRSDRLQLTKTSCLGPCRFAPVVQVYPEDVSYGLLDDVRLDEIVDEHLVHGRPVVRLALPAGDTAKRGR